MFRGDRRTHRSENLVRSFRHGGRRAVIGVSVGSAGAAGESGGDPNRIADRSGDSVTLVVGAHGFIAAALRQERVSERSQRHANSPTVADLAEDRDTYGFELMNRASRVA